MNKKEALKKADGLLQQARALPIYKKNNNQEYDKWHRRIEDFFQYIPYIEKYSSELEDIKFKDNPAQQGFDEVWKSTGELDRYNRTIKDTVSLIDSVIDKINEWDENAVVNLQTTTHGNTTVNIINISSDKPKTKVFIVHGHDELAISQVSEIIKKLKLEPIVLKDQVSRSSTVIEKIEANTNDIGFGVVLYTECDIGGKDKDSLKSRARQNVVLEHGYLMAKIGRENTFALVKGKVETPGDISGVVYTQMDDHKAWSFTLAKELKASGFDIDLNNLA